MNTSKEIAAKVVNEILKDDELKSMMQDCAATCVICSGSQVETFKRIIMLYKKYFVR